jgi:hypothetical protein
MWSIEFDPGPHLMTLRLVHQVTAPQMRALARAHTQALGATGGDWFRVLADLRGMTPLDSDAASIFSEMRRACAAVPTFRGRVVLTDSATVAMQQRRTVLEESGSPKVELITMDEAEARAWLARRP